MSPLAEAIDRAIEFVKAHPDEMSRDEVRQLEALADSAFMLAVRAGLEHLLPAVGELRAELESQDPPLPPVQFITRLHLGGDWTARSSDSGALPPQYHVAGEDLPPAPAESRFLPCATERWFHDMGQLRELAEAQPPPPPPPPPPVETVGDKEYVILRALRNKKPLRISLEELEDEAEVTRKTCGEVVNRLISRGLAERPDGPRGGATITRAGEELLVAAESHLATP
jgi:hypothetical protein